MLLVGAAQTGRHTRVLFLGPRPFPRALHWLASQLEAWARPHPWKAAPPNLAWALEVNEVAARVIAFSLGGADPCASLSVWATFCRFYPDSYFSEFLFSEPKLGCVA